MFQLKSAVSLSKVFNNEDEVNTDDSATSKVEEMTNSLLPDICTIAPSKGVNEYKNSFSKLKEMLSDKTDKV